VPIWWSGAACGERRLVAGGTPTTTPLFHAYPESARPAAPAAIPLRVNPRSGARARGFAPLAYVFESPLRVRLPVSAYLPAVTADAGPDRCLREERVGEGAPVTLDASRSRGSTLRYAWRWPGGAAAGVRARVRLPAGLHDVRLELVGADGRTAQDALVIEVAPALRPG
jgi:hypothetical protein